MGRISDFVKNLKLSREKVIPAIFAIAMTSAFFIDTTYLNNMLLMSMWAMIAMLFSLILLVVMLVAGFAVFKALVHASVALTLLIFLAQTYCALPVTTPEGTQALSLLFGVGMLYIFYEFGTKFYEACKELLKRLGDDKKTSQGRFMIGLFALFAVWFVWAIYQVVSPIALNLCIYQ